MQAICVVAAFFFLSALFTRFPYPHPCCSTTPSRTGQQEIGIQCFLDDFLKEMDLSQKMRTMNNETLDGMCPTHVIHTTCTVAESHVWNWRLWSQGWKELWVGPLEWGETNWFSWCTYNHFGLDANQRTPVRIGLTFGIFEKDYIFFLYS